MLTIVGLLNGLIGVQVPPSLSEVRELYLQAVQDKAAIAQGLETIERIRAARALQPMGTSGAFTAEETVLDAYEGALITLRAKHNLWPPTRLRHLREGLAILDESVAHEPAHAEVRYLRLLSCYYLPAILGRGDSVREDLAALAELLPAAAEQFPPNLYRTMVRFVLETGGLEPHERAELESVTPADGR